MIVALRRVISPAALVMVLSAGSSPEPRIDTRILSNGLLESAAHWVAVRPGLEYSEIALAGSGEGWRTKLIVARLDPRVIRLALDTAFVAYRPAWRAEGLDAGEAFAVNAGQFAFALPWGWVVLNGKQYLAAGTGPLSSTFIVSNDGRVRWTHATVPATPGGIAWAFQSYPTLLRHGQLPTQLTNGSINITHRDARAAIGQDDRGRIIVAITRFDALGGALGFVPFGLTTPEMARVMLSLGAREAMMLDGGISAQMAVRDSSGSLRTWRGVRAVPLALVGR